MNSSTLSTSTHTPLFHAWSSPPPLLTRPDDWNYLRDGVAWSQARVQARIPSIFALSIQEYVHLNGGTPNLSITEPVEERIKRWIEDLVRELRRVQDVPEIVDYISGILKTGSINSGISDFLKDTVLQACRLLAKDTVYYCNSDSCLRLQATVALLGHLVKRRVISIGPALTFAEELLLEINKPYRIECASLLLVDQASGILTNRHRALEVNRILTEMRARRRDIAVLRQR